MSSIPSNISRVPNALASQLFYANLNRTNLSLLDLQSKMATGRAINRPSDDAVRASAVAVLDDVLERAQQRLRNLDAADATLSLLDSSLGEASELVLEARNIASSQVGATSDPQTRRNQAVVVDSLIRQLFNIANRKTNGVHLFGGSTAASPPVQELLGGYRYVGRGSGLHTDLGAADHIPITLGGNNTIGQTSARLRAMRDLDPALTGDTRLADIGGARGAGISLSPLSFSFDGGPAATIDLAGCDTAQNVADRITAAIRQYEADHGVTILGPGGVSFSGGSLRIDVVAGAGGPDPLLVFSDIGTGVSAQDLGLAQAPFSATTPAGADLNPRLTLLTPVSALSGVTRPLGSINVRFAGATTSTLVTVDLSSAQTVGDIRNLIQTAVPGARVEINAPGTGIDVFNEVSGPRMSIEEVPGGADTATELGIRTFTGQTRLSDFNDGRGVRIVNGATDPVTGQPDPAGNVDFVVRLGDGSTFTVDLRPQDLVSVQTLVDRINEEAASAVTAGRIPAGAFAAGLTDGPNGLALRDLAGLGRIEVIQQNNSPAPGDLGLLDGSWDAASATFVAQDRAAVRVNNLFSTLIDLRDALNRNDSRGIELASAELDGAVDSLSATHALVGVYAGRVEKARQRQEDQMVLDERTRSELRDLDFTEASIRFSLLQTQLLAGMQTAGSTLNRTLLDFLG
jgi:flagellar hook-associated protein 3 FlgL